MIRKTFYGVCKYPSKFIYLKAQRVSINYSIILKLFLIIKIMIASNFSKNLIIVELGWHLQLENINNVFSLNEYF